jgi:hypothetical protein
MPDKIVIPDARQHDLKSLSLEPPPSGLGSATW